MQDKINSL